MGKVAGLAGIGAFAMAILVSTTSSGAPSASADVTASIDAYATAQMDELHIPGLALG